MNEASSAEGFENEHERSNQTDKEVRMMRQASFLTAVLIMAAGFSTKLSHAAMHGLIPVTFVEGVSSTTDGPIDDVAATGELLVGMVVTVVFEDGSEETTLWEATGPQSGGAVAATWSLTQLGDTIVGSWFLQNSDTRGIVACIVDGAPAAALFDTSFGGQFGTPDSGAGVTIIQLPASTTFALIDVIYRDMTGIEGTFGVGDLYRFLEVYFTSEGGLLPEELLAFQADVDLLELQSEVIPTGDVNLSDSVDLADFALLSRCLAGPDNETPPILCLFYGFDQSDLDRDGDTDLADYSQWTLSFSR